MSVNRVIKIGKPTTIKVMSKGKKKFIDEFVLKAKKHLSKLDDESTIICTAIIVTTTRCH
jgi:hypothetical protein